MNIKLWDLCETLIVHILLSIFQKVHMVLTVIRPDFIAWIESADWIPWSIENWTFGMCNCDICHICGNHQTSLNYFLFNSNEQNDNHFTFRSMTSSVSCRSSLRLSSWHSRFLHFLRSNLTSLRRFLQSLQPERVPFLARMATLEAPSEATRVDFLGGDGQTRNVAARACSNIGSSWNIKT